MTRTRIATAALVAATAGLLSGVSAAGAAPVQSTPIEAPGADATQLEQYERAFAKIDADASGKVEATDIAAREQRWYYELGVEPHSAQGHKIDGRARDLWREVLGRADANRDQEVSKAESDASVQGPAFVQKVVLPYSLASFDVSDRDGDRTLSLEELRTVQTDAGASETDIRDGFRQLDTDRSGSVQRSEFSPAVHDVYERDRADWTLTQLVTNFL